MIVKELKDFDIAQICESGQCFRMEPKGECTYAVIAGDRYLEVKQESESCSFYCEEKEFDTFWKDYFDLGRDYGAYKSGISSRDSYLLAACRLGAGIRILNQDLWEMIVSFLISQQNNITRIRKCIHNICEKYGERRLTVDGIFYYTFPSAETLSCLHEEELKGCNLGYRSKYVVRTAKAIADGTVSLEAIKCMPYKKAKGELLKLFGVGEKVADCICLFALHHLDAFPVDTHISQALSKHYPKGFPKRRYKGYEGVIQQYIFYYELVGKGAL